MKSVDSTPTAGVSVEGHAQTSIPSPAVVEVVPLTTDIEAFTSIRDKLVQRMREEINAAEETLAELNQQFATLFPELVSDDQPAPKAKKPKPKASTKSESVTSDSPSSTE